LNDPSILILYNQIFLFQNDHSQSEILFINRSYSEQKALQSLAHGLNLEYEYSLVTRTVRICRRTPSGDSLNCGPGYFDFLNCEYLQDIERWSEATLDIPVTVHDTRSIAWASTYELTISEGPPFSGLEDFDSELHPFAGNFGQKAFAENGSPDESLGSLRCDNCYAFGIYCDNQRPACGSCTWSKTSCYYKGLFKPLYVLSMVQ
jgi:hypothetical protein